MAIRTGRRLFSFLPDQHIVLKNPFWLFLTLFSTVTAHVATAESTQLRVTTAGHSDSETSQPSLHVNAQHLLLFLLDLQLQGEVPSNKKTHKLFGVSYCKHSNVCFPERYYSPFNTTLVSFLNLPFLSGGCIEITLESRIKLFPFIRPHIL